jgi:ABC-type lipoprotein export system ATPase subunit
MDAIRKAHDDFGTTVIIVTHDSQIAQRTDRVMKLVDGVIE